MDLGFVQQLADQVDAQVEEKLQAAKRALANGGITTEVMDRLGIVLERAGGTTMPAATFPVWDDRGREITCEIWLSLDEESIVTLFFPCVSGGDGRYLPGWAISDPGRPSDRGPFRCFFGATWAETISWLIAKYNEAMERNRQLIALENEAQQSRSIEQKMIEAGIEARRQQFIDAAVEIGQEIDRKIDALPRWAENRSLALYLWEWCQGGCENHLDYGYGISLSSSLDSEGFVEFINKPPHSRRMKLNMEAHKPTVREVFLHDFVTAKIVSSSKWQLVKAYPVQVHGARRKDVYEEIYGHEAAFSTEEYWVRGWGHDQLDAAIEAPVEWLLELLGLGSRFEVHLDQ